MNPLRDKKGIFFLLMACVVQVFMLLSCTLWRGIILPPVPWKCPLLERDYWFWLLDEYVPPVPYEEQLTSLYYNLAPLLRVLLLAGLIWLFWRIYRKSRWGLLCFFGLLAVTGAAYLLLIAWLRQYGQPFYLYMEVVSDSWLLAVDVLILLLLPLFRPKGNTTPETLSP